MDDKNGIGVAGVLAIVFIVLKMTRLIDWGWQWVLSPLWISWIIVLLLWAWLKLMETE